MNLVHVVPHINEEATGPSYSVPRLCESLASQGHRVELTCLAAGNKLLDGVKLSLYPQWGIAPRFAVSPALVRSLREKAGIADIVHNHSLWSMVNVGSGIVVPGGRAKLVTSPRGTLSKWALHRRRHVKRVLWLLQRRALTEAHMLHATSEVELGEIRSMGLKAPVVVIPNGIDIPESCAPQTFSATRTLLFLSRIHPTKCVDRLLEAWKALEPDFPNWKLIIAGRGEPDYVDKMKVLASSLALKQVTFPGPLYGAKKSRAYQEADLFILPSHSENFGMVVAEALAHGCPVIVSKGAPWSEIASRDCGWWVEHDAPHLIASLRVAMRQPADRLAAMGLKGRVWMSREFGWKSIAERMATAYRWLIYGGDIPVDVYLD